MTSHCFFSQKSKLYMYNINTLLNKEGVSTQSENEHFRFTVCKNNHMLKWQATFNCIYLSLLAFTAKADVFLLIWKMRTTYMRSSKLTTPYSLKWEAVSWQPHIAWKLFKGMKKSLYRAVVFAFNFLFQSLTISLNIPGHIICLLSSDKMPAC